MFRFFQYLPALCFVFFTVCDLPKQATTLISNRTFLLPVFPLNFKILAKLKLRLFRHNYLRTQAWRAGRVLQRVLFFFGISHSPRTPLGHAHRWSICKHYVDKLQRFSPKCHNIFILTMPTALGWRSGAVYGEKSPKTRLVRIYCYGNTLYIVNLITWQAMFARLII